MWEGGQEGEVTERGMGRGGEKKRGNRRRWEEGEEGKQRERGRKGKGEGRRVRGVGGKGEGKSEEGESDVFITHSG